MPSHEHHFAHFRQGIIGQQAQFSTFYGTQTMIYADWTASGRLYAPIEQRLLDEIGPFVGNTHSESSATGTAMTHAYHYAQQLIKRHVNASPNDVLIATGSGMTSAVNKLQRMLGLRIAEQLQPFCTLPELRPVVFVTHMEHHSNHTSWIETIADVVVIDPDAQGLVDLQQLEACLQAYQDRPLKIGAFTACSNVTGIQTPYHAMAKLMHAYGGWCFVDFAASAPYITINMHPDDPAEKLDAIYFSPHKFLGGPGSAGILIFDAALYHNRVPDKPGGGTVLWTNPWNQHQFIDSIEAREDGGTPGFLQTIRAALAMQLKTAMGIEAIHQRETELTQLLLTGLRAIPRLHILADQINERLSIVSFWIEDLHYNLVVRLLNDCFGIQVRGGCSCAGTYGHYLLEINQQTSHTLFQRVEQGDLLARPGWVRVSLHPTMTIAEVQTILQALADIVEHGTTWSQDYIYNPVRNEYQHCAETTTHDYHHWFAL